MKQIARNVTMDEWGILEGCRYLIHDRDTKFTDSFRAIVKSSHVDPLKLPARSPNLNAYAERWLKSVKEEALSKLILFSEASLRRVLSEYLVHFHGSVTIKAKATYCYFQPPRKQRIVLTDQLVVKNAWVGCLNITIGTLHVYFDVGTISVSAYA
jgi:hypothetical protein